MNNYKPIELSSESINPVFTIHNIIIIIEFVDLRNGKCIIMQPILKKVFSALEKPFVYYRINTDNTNVLVSEYHIFSVPQYLFFFNQQLIGKISGVHPFYELLLLFEEVVNQVIDIKYP